MFILFSTSKDTPGALFLLDKAMPTILDGTANCAIIFDKVSCIWILKFLYSSKTAQGVLDIV